VNEFLQVDLLGQVDSAPPPDRKFGGSPFLTVKEALDRAAARIGQRFQDQPLVEAAIQSAIGSGYLRLKEHDLAVPHLQRAFGLRKVHLGPDHSDTLRSMSDLANGYQWVRRHSEAIALRLQLLENRRASLGPDHRETLDCMGAG
jgi:hypothetical protein